MNYQMTFKRHEIKYLITTKQKEQLMKVMEPYMKMDQYGRTTIRNIYFDTRNFRLIRRSLEKPTYKEKLRIRSYQAVRGSDPIFVELKKKYDSVVYKRRLVLPEEQAAYCFKNGEPLPSDTQISSEIETFRKFYKELIPAVFLSYEREAFYALDGGEFRVTFDDNILFRNYDFSLEKGIYGTSLLERDQVLMEIKTPGGIPLWMTHALADNCIYPTSFSKYGTAYRKIRNKKTTGGYCYA